MKQAYRYKTENQRIYTARPTGHLALQSRYATLEIIPYLFWSWCSTIILLSQGRSREDSWFHFPVIRIPCDVWNPDMIHKTQDKTCIQIDQETFKNIYCTPHWASCIFQSATHRPASHTSWYPETYCPYTNRTKPKKIERDGMIGSSTSLKHGSLTENRGVSKKKKRRGSYRIPKSLTGNECRLASV